MRVRRSQTRKSLDEEREDVGREVIIDDVKEG